MSNWIDEFCGSPFWDSNLTWYTESPQLTPCFERTVLVWVPCIFLWLFLSFEIYAICSSSRRNIPWNWRNISKVIIIGILIFTTLFDFFYNIKEKWEGVITYPVEIYTPLIKLLSLIICLGLVLCHVRCGQQSSGLLFMFWFLVSLLGIPRVYSDLNLYSSDSTNICLISNCISYSLSVIIFLLNFFADLPPKFVDYPPTDNPSPEQGASFPSRITFCWFDSLAQLGFKRPLLHSDLWSMNFEDRASQILPIFDKYWNATLEKSKVKLSSEDKLSNNIEMGESSKKVKPVKQCSILPALFRAFGPPFLLAGCLKFCQDILAFVSPQLLKYLISYVEGDEPRWRGYLYSALMLAVASLQTLFLAQYFNKIMLLGLRMRTALISAIYRKALRLSNSARKDSTVGEIVNLMSVDAQRFMDLMTYFNMLWSAPLQICLSLYFLWMTLGPCVLAGLAVMLIMIPFNAVLANKIKKLQIKQMKNKDERIKMMNEILSGIKVLKLYAWEPSFEQQILKIRGKEVSVLRQSSYLNAGTAFLWACSPFLVALVTFATYVLIDENNVLDASKAFVSLSLFNLLRFPLSMLPNLISTLIQAKVSLNRLNGFINKEELDPDAVFHDEHEVDSLIIENGVFSWSSSEAAVLKNINLRVKPGSLVAIVGAVGSGKSSLLSAFLGEMEKIAGRVNTKGSLAYVPQIAWIQNATLQDNILFGKPLNKRFYNKIVKGSALEQDLEIFPGGDQTEIGEKGINLSGGQKQRVSLARAVYQDADNYFLDDPLSAVDSHVARHIFDNVIGNNGILHKKTRLLVTHGLTYLPEVDMIFVLKDGSISEVGTYNELVQNKGAFSEFLTLYMQEGGNDADGSQVDVDTTEDLTGQRSRQQSISSTKNSSSISLDRQASVEPESKDMAIGEKLIEEEKSQTGSVGWSVFSHYLGAIGLRYCLATLILSVLYQGFAVSSNFWLSIWSSDRALLVNGTQDTDKRNLYIEVYGLLGLGQFSVVLVLGCCIYLGTLKAAYLLHNLLLTAILQVPVSFFDVTPLGRIINRFGKDVDTLDNVLPFSLRGWVNCLFSVLATLFVISYSTPIFMAIVVPIGFIYYFIQRFYVATSRQLKRLESVSRSPIYSHFGESVSGTSTIRAYNAQERFIKESEDKVDFNQICTLPGVIANRWLAVRLEMIGNLIIFFSALFAVINKENLTPGLVGLSVSYALQITQNLNWFVRMSSEVETNIVAVERIKEYADTPQEADWDVTPCPASGDWPREGQVEFSQFQVRYRPELELVLKGASFVVRGGEKVGIVGRTGAGKSSLTLGLFRILEAAGGHIYIDGVDIALLGLHKLRMALTIIPQDPVLFSGTLRNNLDPFGVYSDAEVWRALELAHLKSFVKGLTAGLHHIINEGGSNLSVGQRQLICLARALLRKTKILILDEATAAVDLETDDLVQRTIRSEFANCTVLTIAHRINTIMDSDRVIVLDKGLVSEFDTPGVLLKNRSSLFYEMVHDAGLI